MAPRPKNPPTDRRQEILEAALHLFAEKGYIATTNADIARAAGVTPAALYYYFPSKEELFRAAATERRGTLTPTLSPLVAEDVDDLPPQELLPAVLRNVVAFLTEERTQALLKIIVSEGVRDPTVTKIWEDQIAEVAFPFFPYLLRRMEQGKIRAMDPRLFFLAFLGPIMATVITRDLLKLPMLQDISNEALIESLLQTTLPGLMTPMSKEE